MPPVDWISTHVKQRRFNRRLRLCLPFQTKSAVLQEGAAGCTFLRAQRFHASGSSPPPGFSARLVYACWHHHASDHSQRSGWSKPTSRSPAIPCLDIFDCVWHPVVDTNHSIPHLPHALLHWNRIDQCRRYFVCYHPSGNWRTGADVFYGILSV